MTTPRVGAVEFEIIPNKIESGWVAKTRPLDITVFGDSREDVIEKAGDAVVTFLNALSNEKKGRDHAVLESLGIEITWVDLERPTRSRLQSPRRSSVSTSVRELLTFPVTGPSAPVGAMG